MKNTSASEEIRDPKHDQGQKEVGDRTSETSLERRAEVPFQISSEQPKVVRPYEGLYCMIG